MIEEIIAFFLDRQIVFDDKLRRLWDSLSALYPAQMGPYPADHGINHIERVVMNLLDLLSPIEKQDAPKFITELLAAAFLHDIAMIPMRVVGAYSPEAEQIRLEHSKKSIITKLAQPILNSIPFLLDQQDIIINIASAHAGDDERTAGEKLDEMRKNEEEKGLVLGVCLLRIADFLHMGPSRLTVDVRLINWRDPQISHLHRHLSVTSQIDANNRSIQINLNRPEDNTLIPLINKIARLKSVFEDARDMVNQLNEYIGKRYQWNLKPLDESWFGTVTPLSSDVGLFAREFERAEKEWHHQGSNSPLVVDLMGHSLLQRFLIDSEKINKKLKEYLINGRLQIRILLLDPTVESQQAYEVYEAQKSSQSESGRSILPKYNRDLQPIVDPGDINRTLTELHNNWIKFVPKYDLNSSLEVRLTTRIMYASVNRFGNRMIVTPYSQGGLFKESLALLISNKSPLFNSYCNEFNSIWNSADSTRLYLHKHSISPKERSPLRQVPVYRYINNTDPVPFFNYERSFFEKNVDRIRRVMDKPTEILPPYEVEIQPSAQCDLKCEHCVGSVFPPGISTIVNSSDLFLSRVKTMLDYKADVFGIERVRISGLKGDPFFSATRELSIKIINEAKERKKEIVVLTNGISLGDQKVKTALYKVNFVHISLDAATDETFERLKNGSRKQFETIEKNVKDFLCDMNKKEPHPQVGFGFVITQQNADDVEPAIELAKKIGVHFIRFRPDVRIPGRLSWRTWSEAEELIKQQQQKENGCPRIYLTSVPWYGLRTRFIKECPAQFFYTSIGPDGGVYRCDHLTSSGKSAQLGNLLENNFEYIWTKSSNEIGRRCSACAICPPLFWRVNELLEELRVLRQSYTWKNVLEIIREEVAR